jgi:cell division protein FtsB
MKQCTRFMKKAYFGFLLLLLIALQVRLWLGPNGLDTHHQLQHDIARQTEENLRLQQRNARLTEDVADLKNGTDTLEALARSELGLIKQNENFYQIIE